MVSLKNSTKYFKKHKHQFYPMSSRNWKTSLYSFCEASTVLIPNQVKRVPLHHQKKPQLQANIPHEYRRKNAHKIEFSNI